MPRSRSRSFELSARSTVAWFSRNAPDCLSSASTSVVLPWSTCAMIAMLRISMRGVPRGPAAPLVAAVRNGNAPPHDVGGCGRNACPTSRGSDGSARKIVLRSSVTLIAARLRFGGHFALAMPSAKIVFQSSFMLMTIQPSALAVSISAWPKVPIWLSGRPSAGP